MKEFMLGLSTYGLDQMIIQNPLVCQPLLVAEDLKEGVTPNADYLYSLLEPHYSREGTSRRCFEEDIIIFFQDILNDCETGNVVGHQAPIACNHKEEQRDEAMNQDQSLVFESLSLSVPGITCWLTGSKHKPISGKGLKYQFILTVTVYRISQGTLFVFLLLVPLESL